MKTGPLSKAEKFYIDSKMTEGVALPEISKELERSVDTVKKYLEDAEVPPTADTSSTVKIRPEDRMAYKKFGRNNKGSTVMTEAASEYIDTVRKQTKKPGAPDQSSFIHKIRPE